MTTESLIGIIGSVVGILAAGIPFGKWLLKSIKEQFPNKIIETIDYNKIAKEGGLLNCTTWVLRK